MSGTSPDDLGAENLGAANLGAANLGAANLGADDLGAEDAKLVTLARAARTRAYAPHGRGPVEGAAVRDEDGRTYAAGTVEHGDVALATSALRGAVVAAASSGARRFEAAVVVTDGEGVGADDLRLLGEFGSGVPVLVADVSGAVVARTTT
jgi:hypothetical protein